MLNDWDFIKQNKPDVTKTVTLRMQLSMGKLTGHNWDTTFYENWDTVITTVQLNQDKIYSGVIDEPIELVWQFIDTDEPQTHRLTVTVQGLDQLAEKNVMISMTGVTVENLSLNKVIEFTGTYVDSNHAVNVASEYMGKDGQTTITFSTPIYRWLFDNQKYFV
jgi:hypothetical protein